MRLLWISTLSLAGLIMHLRSSHGVSVAFVAACAFVIVAIGVALFFLMQLFGGFREFQNATDAGNLNVAKEALKIPSYNISNSYQSDFAGLVDSNGSMDLLAYNRVVGQAFLVSMNAMADRPQAQPNQSTNPAGSPSALGLQDAQLVCQAANGGVPANNLTGVGAQLFQLFANTSGPLYQNFTNVANTNSMRMMGADGGIQLSQANCDYSWMGVGSPTNVSINSSTLPSIGNTGVAIQPPATTLTSSTDSSGNPLLSGYVSMPLGAAQTSWSLVGVPVFPGTTPHHVAARDFYNDQAANEQAFSKVVPPNAFKSASAATDVKTQGGQQQVVMQSYAQVGVMNTTYQASIPLGYIEIVNPAGYVAPPLAEPDVVWNRELMEGIYLGTTSSGGAVFTTNMNLIQQWVAYNANPSGTPPPTTDPVSGQPLLYFTNGNDGPASITSAGYTDANGTVNGSTPCMWFDSDPGVASPCADLIANFWMAYPPGPPQSPASQPPMTAIEKLKYNVIALFNTTAFAFPYAGADGTVNCDGPLTLPDGTQQVGTGLRYWTGGSPGAPLVGRQVTHPPMTPSPPSQGDMYQGWVDSQAGGNWWDATWTAESPIQSGQPVVISQPGTISQLISETVSSPAMQNTIYSQIAQRMQEINPSTTQSAAISWLQNSSQTFDLGTTNYIYYDSKSASWQVSSTPPPGAVAPVQPDGSLQRYTSDAPGSGYSTIGTIADPHYENGIEFLYYLETPLPMNGYSLGMDEIDWQPSSGYHNLLGVLSFHNYCGCTPALPNPGGYYSMPD